MSDELTYTTMDRSDWGPGPWDDEPDKVQWRDPETGIACLAVRGRMGSWCGYAGVEEDHPAFEKGYNEVNVDVHGGLTYANHCMEGPEETVVCHIPEPGKPDHVWWLGFDCAHFMDLVPHMEAYRRKTYEETGDPIWAADEHVGSYKPLSYVRKEVTDLARQLAEMG